MDNDVFLSGFPLPPNADKVTTALTTLFKIPEELVDYKYVYEFEPRQKYMKKSSTPNQSKARKVFHHMVKSFKERSAKMRFMQEKKKNGPMTYEQLSNDKMTAEQRTTTIRCTNRLSKFNLRAQYVLMTAKNEGKIYAFQLHNGAMRVKCEEKAPWEHVDTDESLEPFISREKKKAKESKSEDFEDASEQHDMST